MLLTELGIWGLQPVLHWSSKSHIQAVLTIKINCLWALPIKIIYIKSNSLNRNDKKYHSPSYKTLKITTSTQLWLLTINPGDAGYTDTWGGMKMNDNKFFFLVEIEASDHPSTVDLSTFEIYATAEVGDTILTSIVVKLDIASFVRTLDYWQALCVLLVQ